MIRPCRGLAGVRLVMVSWAAYPALDPRRPGGLSSAVVRGELRRRLEFTGVTLTDALGAGALRAFGTTSSRAVLAAGQNVSEGTSAADALATALRAAGSTEAPSEPRSSGPWRCEPALPPDADGRQMT